MLWLYLISFLIGVIYLIINYVFSYWQRKNIPFIKPTLLFGNLGPSIRRQISIGVNLKNLYDTSNEPIVGIYSLFRPMLLIRDAEIAKTILTTDFSYFHDRGVMNGDPKTDPICENIFGMDGLKWKSIRSKISPTFTLGKLRVMIPTVLKIGDILQKKLDKSAENSDIIDIKELCARYGMDVIGTVGFGLDVNCIDNPEHPFRMIERGVNNTRMISTIRWFGWFMCPELLRFLKLSQFPKEFTDYMYNIVKSTIDYRQQNNISQKDLLQFIIELLNMNKSNDNNNNDKDDNFDNNAVTIEQCAGQLALFYLAGFDTTSSTIAYCLYELARNKELMKRLQDDIDETLQKHNGEITYDSINDIELLEFCVLETVRKYPTLPLLNRICTRDYESAENNIKISKGTPIVISILGLMRDAKHFPEPMKFMPERFSSEINNYNPSAYIPFGDGPRACIGVRLGKIVAKIALIQVLHTFNIESVDDKELNFGTYSVPLVIDGGVNVRITRRNK